MIQNPLRTPLKLHASAFLACAVFSLLPLLPSRASALPLFSGLRLPSSPRALSCFSCLPASLPFVLFGVCGFPPFLFGLLAWPVFCLVWCVWCFLVLIVSVFSLGLAYCSCRLCLTSAWTGALVPFAFTYTTKALIFRCTCVSVRRLDRFTCTFHFHRVNQGLVFFVLVCLSADY